MRTFNIVISILFYLIIGCNSQKENVYELGHNNSVVINNVDDWDKVKNSEVNLSPCKDMDLRFINNPFDLKDENISLYFNNTVLIYKGKYSEVIDVCIPDSLIHKTISPGLSIYKNGKTYNFLGKSYLEILSDDKYLNIVFMPEKGQYGSCLIFSNRVELPK